MEKVETTGEVINSILGIHHKMRNVGVWNFCYFRSAVMLAAKTTLIDIFWWNI